MRSEPNRWLVLVLVCIAQFMVVLDATIVNVALPSIQHGLHFSPPTCSGSSTATRCSSAASCCSAAALRPARPPAPFIAGVVLFTARLAASTASPTSSSVLIAGRALQGLGAALVSPAALSIVTTTFAEGTERTKALGVWSAIAAGGAAVGLIIGGLLTEYLSWRWVFFVNLPVGSGSAALAALHSELARGRAADTLRHRGRGQGHRRPARLVYAIVKAQAYGWGSVKTIGLFALAIAAARRIRDHRAALEGAADPARHLPHALADARATSRCCSSRRGIFAMFYFASLYLQEILGYEPLKAGFASCRSPSGSSIGAGAAQPLIRRIGIRAVTSIGFALGARRPALLRALIPTHGTYFSDIFPGIAVMSIGMGLTFVP